MLEVDGEVAIDGTFVDTISLAPADAEDFIGADCEIAGWGQTEGQCIPSAGSVGRIILQYLWDPRLDLTSVRCMTKTVGFRSPGYYLSIQVVSKY